MTNDSQEDAQQLMIDVVDRARTGDILQICAWCMESPHDYVYYKFEDTEWEKIPKQVLDILEEEEIKVSHGMCPLCYNKMRQSLKKRRSLEMTKKEKLLKELKEYSSYDDYGGRDLPDEAYEELPLLQQQQSIEETIANIVKTKFRRGTGLPVRSAEQRADGRVVLFIDTDRMTKDELDEIISVSAIPNLETWDVHLLQSTAHGFVLELRQKIKEGIVTKKDALIKKLIEAGSVSNFDNVAPAISDAIVDALANYRIVAYPHEMLARDDEIHITTSEMSNVFGWTEAMKSIGFEIKKVEPYSDNDLLIIIRKS